MNTSSLGKAKIPARKVACCVCRQRFNSGDPVTSRIAEDGDVWARADYCERCFQTVAADDHLCWWKGVAPLFSEERRTLLKGDALVLSHIRCLMDDGNDSDKRMRAYLLLLYLERRGLVCSRPLPGGPLFSVKVTKEEFFISSPESFSISSEVACGLREELQ